VLLVNFASFLRIISGKIIWIHLMLMSIEYFLNFLFNMIFIRRYFHTKLNSDALKKNSLINLFEFLIIFGLITSYKFVQINMGTPNNVCYIFSQSNIQYEGSTILILRITSSGCIKTAVSISCLYFQSFSPHSCT
jgi:hypothetical protein